MLMDFLIQAHSSENMNKWVNYSRQKNELYALYALNKSEILKDVVFESDSSVKDSLVGLVTVDLNPLKLCLLGFLSLKELNKLIGSNFKSKKEVEEEVFKIFGDKSV